MAQTDDGMVDGRFKLVLTCKDCDRPVQTWRWPGFIPTAGVVLADMREHICLDKLED